MATRANYTGLGHLCLPWTVLASDFVVSMPKIKTHHWAGITLRMKNMFGIEPGTKYGWPKNVLHWKGIHRSILDICATEPIHLLHQRESAAVSPTRVNSWIAPRSFFELPGLGV